MGGHRVRLAAVALVAVLQPLEPVPPAVVSPAPNWVRSRLEVSGDHRIQRDCGFSEPVPGAHGDSLWVFCDTVVRDANRRVLDFVPGSTAARGPQRAGVAPAALEEWPTPGSPVGPSGGEDRPEAFLPQPTGLRRSDGRPCPAEDGDGGAYSASWTTGVASIPGTAELLLTYIDVCVEGAWDFVVSRMGIVEYAPATNTLSEPEALFVAPGSDDELPEALWLGSPVFADGHLYLFSSRCERYVSGACAGGHVYLARAPAEERDVASSFRFRRGAGWTSEVSRATGIVSGARPSDVAVDAFGAVGRGLVLVETTSVGGHFRVWEADHPAGPWTQRGAERRLPGCQPPVGVVDLCRAVIGQPELSTVDDLAVTYYRSEDQHVAMATFPWPAAG